MPILKFCSSPVPPPNFLRPESSTVTDLQLEISLQDFNLELQGGGAVVSLQDISWELPGVGLQKMRREA